MKLALVITVKNERRLLRRNLLYHHRLGVDQVYLYLDGSTDDTEETITDLPFVTVSGSVGVAPFQDQPHWQEFVSTHAEHHTARQMLNIVHAQVQAQRAGCDWLIGLDADELICPHQAQIYPGQLQDFFADIPQAVDLVRFRTLEVLQHRLSYENVFTEETLFKSPSVNLHHQLYDPYQKIIFNHQGYYGQTKGKSAVRPSLPVKPKTPHKFVSMDGADLNTLWKGDLLHYYAYDFDDFIKKFQNFKHRPDRYIVGSKVEPVKRLWRDLVNDPHLTPDALEAYYQRWVLFSPKEIKRLKRNKILGIVPKTPGVISVTAIKDIINET